MIESLCFFASSQIYHFCLGVVLIAGKHFKIAIQLYKNYGQEHSFAKRFGTRKFLFRWTETRVSYGRKLIVWKRGNTWRTQREQRCSTELSVRK